MLVSMNRWWILLPFATYGLSPGHADVRMSEGLTEVPDDLLNDNVVDLTNNSIANVGDGKFGSSLRTLIMNMNALTSISPAAFCGTQLKALHLQYNYFTAVPNLTCMDTLVTINLRDNLLRGHLGGSLFRQFSSLANVQLMRNNLTSVGAEVFCDTALRTLDIQYNSLRAIPDLSCVRDTLKTLYLRNNSICSFKNSDFSAFTNLQVLGVNENCFTSVDVILHTTNLWPTLRSLPAARGTLREVNFTGVNFLVLESLDFSGNFLKCFKMVGYNQC